VGFPVVSVVVNDVVDRDVLKRLAAGGTKLVATRSTGFNHIDLGAARELGVKVVRVVDYSPNSVAEFAVGVLLALNRKIPRAYNRTREGNFELDGLMGFDLVGRTVAVIGTGKIGIIFARIMAGFGCELLGFDVHHSPEFEKLGGRYTAADEIQAEADIISLHCPLTPQTHHIVNARMLARVKRGALLINTSRGGLVDTEAVIEALKSGRLGGIAIDVVRTGGQPLLQGSVEHRDSGRRDPAPRLFPERDRDRASGILHARGSGDDSGHDAAKHLGLCRGPPAGERDRRIGMSANASRWAHGGGLAGWRRYTPFPPDQSSRK
jgi:lactate dehydrogenase-like 2-hydroxyacid dehydrogenase